MSRIEKVLESLKQNHSYDKNYQQAVKEVFEDISELYSENGDYKKFNVLEVLTEPDRVIRFRVQWLGDDGNYYVNRAWRVQFNNCLGAYKGGIRFHKSVNEDTLKFLAFEQCLKNALTGFPMGGAKGGSDFDPKDKSDAEILRFCHAFMDELQRYIGPERDVPAGDIGVGSKEIGYLFGRYLKIKNKYNGAITGKSPSYFGSCVREEATGFGCIYFLEEVLKEHNLELKKKRICISGSGNVALFSAQKAIELNTNVLTVSDSDGYLYFPDGMTEDEIEYIKALKFKNKKRLSDFDLKGSKFKYHKNENPWSEKCDIAIPCATQNEICAQDALNLSNNGCKVVIEGANMPLDGEAVKIVIDNKMIYVPGKIANAGGVAISNLERTQNAQFLQWSFSEVDEKLKEVMSKIHKNATSFVEKKNGIISYKKGANLYGFKKLADAIVSFGIV